MSARKMFFVISAAVLSLASLARAQFPNISAEQMQEMMGMQRQMMQNMQQAGIDPVEMGQQMMQQMQDGTFDPAAMQQQLVDKGVINQQMLDRMNELGMNPANQQQMMQQRRVGNATGNLQQLGASDEEWKVLEPKIERVRTALAAAGQAGQIRMAGLSSAGRQASESAVTKALTELRAALADEATPSKIIDAKLKAWRSACEKAETELAAARKDLVNLVTQRQEGILAILGFLK